MTEVWIVQPYVPSYRVPFFEGLSAALTESAITLRVVAGRPGSVQARRGDSVAPPWLTEADDKVLRGFGRSVTLTRTRRHWRNADAVIVPHMGSSFDALSALGRKSGLKVGVWGHIASYTSKPNPVDQVIEHWELRRADHVFAYTRSGAVFAAGRGVKTDRITTVMNSIDTSSLNHDLDHLTADDLNLFRSEHGIPSGNVYAFIGGLDESKRISFLAATLDELAKMNSDVHIVVGGQGSQAALLNRAIRRGQVSLLGHVSGRRKAAVLKTSTAIVNPGRIGLLAVDALVANRRVLTTDWPFHAPEAEYLVAGKSRLTSADDPRSFAELLVGASRMESDSESRPDFPTLDEMIANFASGVRTLLNARRTRHRI